MTIHDKLCELREEKGLSQEELAAELGVSRQTVGKWENGRAVPRGDNLDRLSRYYGVSIDALMNGGPPEPEAPAPENAPEPEETVPEPEPKRKKRRWPFVLAAALLAAAIAVGGFLLWRSLDRTIPEDQLKSEEVIEPLPPALPLLPLE